MGKRRPLRALTPPPAHTPPQLEAATGSVDPAARLVAPSPEGFHMRFWKPYGPRGATGAAGLDVAAEPAAMPAVAPGGPPRGRHAGAGMLQAGGRQPLAIGSGPGSRNLGPPAAVASWVTQPMGFGNCGEEGCRIWMRMMPFFSLKDGDTCSTISPSCSLRTSSLLRSSVARTRVLALTTRHFFGGKCLGREVASGCMGSGAGAAPGGPTPSGP
mmetsp:Transcript_96887/g.312853  ORF Transcript_96887/g.312853 Transcript_96887/m.312853 type:complete len:214 (-) Transcript_96887:1043-1684(-)